MTQQVGVPGHLEDDVRGRVNVNRLFVADIGNRDEC
jgi:hypothetical protein